jgi:hypothetical protein
VAATTGRSTWLSQVRSHSGHASRAKARCRADNYARSLAVGRASSQVRTAHGRGLLLSSGSWVRVLPGAQSAADQAFSSTMAPHRTSKVVRCGIGLSLQRPAGPQVVGQRDFPSSRRTVRAGDPSPQDAEPAIDGLPRAARKQRRISPAFTLLEVLDCLRCELSDYCAQGSCSGPGGHRGGAQAAGRGGVIVRRTLLGCQRWAQSS